MTTALCQNARKHHKVELATSSLFAQQVVRGLYLQQSTSSSVVVRWRTEVPTDSAVRLGLDAAKLDQEAETKWKTTEHVMILEGLKPSTRYHYAVGNAEKTFLSLSSADELTTDEHSWTR